jgi:hypothetical protein
MNKNCCVISVLIFFHEILCETKVSLGEVTYLPQLLLILTFMSGLTQLYGKLCVSEEI